MSSHATSTIGLDVGTGSSKAALLDRRGSVLATASAAHPSRSPREGWMEQDPEEWVRSSLSALREVTARRPDADVVAIGLSGQMDGPVLLDGAGAPVGNCLIWADVRGEEYCSDVAAAAPAPGLVALTGKPAVPAYTAPKLLWLARHEPERFRRARSMLLPKDYLRLRLGGSLVTDPTDASNTLLFDLRRREWCGPLLAALDLPRELMPDVVESAAAAGHLSTAAAEATGLPAGVPFVAGAGDSITAVIGAGLAPGDVLVSLGSAGNVSAILDAPHVDDRCRVHTGCHADERWISTAVQPTAGLALRWIADAVATPAAELGALVERAATVEAAAAGLVFLPHLAGQRNPRYDPHARGAFVGLTLSTGTAQLTRAVMEGVAFAQREAIEALRELGVPVSRLVVVGGGARGPLWPQILADVNGLPAVALGTDGDVDGSALGAAILAGVSAGHFASLKHTPTGAHAHGRQFHPAPARTRAYDDAYAIYQGLSRGGEVGA